MQGGGAGSCPVSRRSLAATTLLLIALLTGCGGGSEGDRPAGAGPDLGVPISLADCSDWRDAGVEERLGTIRQLREFVGGPVAGRPGRGSVLEDEEAYDLFEGWCENEFARGFKLYKLYSRAAAFSGR